MENSGRHFVLVHGACHGAWCWFKVVTLLRVAGHTVTALDMAASGINPKQLDDLHTYADYIEPLLSFMAALGPCERVILVGHSAGGVDISVTMEMFPQKIAVAIFVSATMPGPDLSIADIGQEFSEEPVDYMDSIVTFDKERRVISILSGPNFIATRYYNLSPPEDLTLATLLLRAYPSFYDSESLNLETFTKKNYGSVHRVFIICSHDIGVSEERAMFMIENNPPDDVKTISSDHMSMLSNPQDLFSNFQAIAEKYY